LKIFGENLRQFSEVLKSLRNLRGGGSTAVHSTSSSSPPLDQTFQLCREFSDFVEVLVRQAALAKLPIFFDSFITTGTTVQAVHS
jgi:hypothetical protein